MERASKDSERIHALGLSIDISEETGSIIIALPGWARESHSYIE